MQPVEISVLARVQFAHAVVQALAESEGIRLLHFKGPALDPELGNRQPRGSDADVLVHPDDVARLTDRLRAHQWRLVTNFETGSVFGHAANYWHDQWGYVDVHRSYPGIADAAGAFETMWQHRTATTLAARSCPVPSPVHQSLLLLLHAARERGGGRSASDIEYAFRRTSPAHQQAVRDAARELSAEIPLAAALGELDRFEASPQVDLWRHFSEGGSRREEWIVRLRAARGGRAKARIALESLRTNRDFLAMDLGHEPTRADVARFWWRRVQRATGRKR